METYSVQKFSNSSMNEEMFLLRACVGGEICGKDLQRTIWNDDDIVETVSSI
jgi:hypothetical protein